MLQAYSVVQTCSEHYIIYHNCPLRKSKDGMVFPSIPLFTLDRNSILMASLRQCLATDWSQYVCHCFLYSL